MKFDFSIILSLFVGVFGLMFGNDQTITRVIYAFLIVIAFDILTGVIKAWHEKNLKSQKWIDGFFRKIMMIVCVSFCYYLDNFKILNVGVSLESASAMFFIAGEVISVLENFIALGINLPQPLSDYIAKNTNDSLDLKVNSNETPISNMLVVDQSKIGGDAVGK